MEKVIGYGDMRPGMEVSNMSETDQKLLEIVEGFKKRIKVVGVGGSGCNTISRLSTMDITDTDLIGMNTDAMALLNTVANKKVILGTQLSRGLGAGADLTKGEQSARESMSNIASSIQGSKIV
ncbi:MAG: cell division protein FtsZ, partial [Candidatus Altiarchaeota archaeon]|nr:cell division protein FtsZ [Candidatus Altiarchaeota archaeon]